MDSILEQFMGREATPFIQFIKYAIAGGLATLVHICVFHVAAWKIAPALTDIDPFVKLLKLEIPVIDDAVRSRNAMIDNVLAFLISNLFCYIINVLWVFTPGRHSWFVALLLFYAASAVSLAIGTALMGWMIRRFGMATTIAFFANILTALMVNYAVRKFVIFEG